MTRILFICLLIINVKSLIKAESICEDTNEVEDFHEGKNFYEFLVNYVSFTHIFIFWFLVFWSHLLRDFLSGFFPSCTSCLAKFKKILRKICLHFARQDEQDGKNGKKLSQLASDQNTKNQKMKILDERNKNQNFWPHLTKINQIESIGTNLYQCASIFY